MASSYSKSELSLDKQEKEYYRLLKNKYSEDQDVRICSKKDTNKIFKRQVTTYKEKLLDSSDTIVSGINLNAVEEKSSSSGDDINPDINGSFTNSPKMGEEDDDEI